VNQLDFLAGSIFVEFSKDSAVICIVQIFLPTWYRPTPSDRRVTRSIRGINTKESFKFHSTVRYMGSESMLYFILSLFRQAEFVPVTCGRGEKYVFVLSKINSSVRSVFDRAQLCP
jgi:hypothetical protein